MVTPIMEQAADQSCWTRLHVEAENILSIIAPHIPGTPTTVHTQKMLESTVDVIIFCINCFKVDMHFMD